MHVRETGCSDQSETWLSCFRPCLRQDMGRLRTWAWDYLTNGLDDDELRDPGLADEAAIKDAQSAMRSGCSAAVQNVIDEDHR